MKILAFLTVLVASLSFSGKSHSQIEIFGISFEMPIEDVIVKLDKNTYRNWCHDELFQLASPCVENGLLMSKKCLSGEYNKYDIVTLCGADLALVRQCYVRSGFSE